MHVSQTSFTDTKYQNKWLQQLIEQCESQSEVDLEKQNLNDEDMKIVVKEAIINKQCKELCLRKNKITSIGALIIAEALNNNTTLEELYLFGNHLCDKGVQYLTKILSFDNYKVDILGVQSSDITDEGAAYLSDMLKYNFMSFTSCR
jgi:Ran GTPase-activating protein (RanGAP) involved in mRNA processing and transport